MRLLYVIIVTQLQYRFKHISSVKSKWQCGTVAAYTSSVIFSLQEGDALAYGKFPCDVWNWDLLISHGFLMEKGSPNFGRHMENFRKGAGQSSHL